MVDFKTIIYFIIIFIIILFYNYIYNCVKFILFTLHTFPLIIYILRSYVDYSLRKSHVMIDNDIIMDSPWPRFRVWVSPVPKTDPSSSFAPVLQSLSNARSSVLNHRVTASSCKEGEQLPSISVAQTIVCELVDHAWFESYGSQAFTLPIAGEWRR